MRLSEETKRAMRAAARWKFGAESSADLFIEIVEADDPWLAAEAYAPGVSGEAQAYGLRNQIDPLSDLDI